jgi:hypothetical protein
VYRRLDPNEIVTTAQKLRNRIHERFPQRNLRAVADELLDVARSTAQRAQDIGKPYLFLRVAIVLFTALILALIVGMALSLNLRGGVSTFMEFVQVLESGVNDLIFLGVAIFFLFTYETRLKRERALAAIHELRALAHVVDMHQLTKDPERLILRGADTASSPERSMSRFELSRYLDYCSELLAVLSKLAALYVQDFRDAVVLDAVDSVEDLTNGLARKIWQKLMILDQMAMLDTEAAQAVNAVHSAPSTPSTAPGPRSA